MGESTSNELQELINSMKAEIADLKAEVAAKTAAPVTYGEPYEMTPEKIHLKPKVEKKPVLDAEGWKKFKAVMPEVKRAMMEGDQVFEQMYGEAVEPVNKQVMAVVMVLIAKGVI